MSDDSGHPFELGAIRAKLRGLNPWPRLAVGLGAAYVIVAPVMLFDPFVIRAQLSEGVFVALAAVMALLVMRREIRVLPMPWPLWAGFGYAGWCFVSVLYSPVPAASLLEAFIILHHVLIAYFVYLLVTRFDAGGILISAHFAVFALVLTFAVLGLVLVYAGVETRLAELNMQIAAALNMEGIIPPLVRLHSTLQPTAKVLALFVPLFSVPLFVWTAFRWRPRLPRWLVLTAGLFCVLVAALTFSRPIVTMALAVAAVALLTRSQRFVVVPRTIATLACTAAFVAFAALETVSIVYPIEVQTAHATNPGHVKPIRAAPGKRPRPEATYVIWPESGTYTSSVTIEWAFNHYAILKLTAWEMARERPLTGGGVGSFAYWRKKLAAEDRVPEEFGSFPYDHTDAQSQFLTPLGETGWPGLALFCLFWFGTAIYLVRQPVASAPFAVGTGWAMLAAVPALIDLEVVNFRYAWPLIGLALGLAQLERDHWTSADGAGER